MRHVTFATADYPTDTLSLTHTDGGLTLSSSSLSRNSLLFPYLDGKTAVLLPLFNGDSMLVGLLAAARVMSQESAPSEQVRQIIERPMEFMPAIQTCTSLVHYCRYVWRVSRSHACSY